MKMKADGETKDRLIASAKSEFMEKGYMKASLRKICSDADVTTGALYFFFKDKEDLFAAIVEPPLKNLFDILNLHFIEDHKFVNNEIDLENHLDEHMDLSSELVHLLYSNYDAFMLLLTKSQGSRFENVVDSLVELLEKFCGELSMTYAKNNPHLKINEYMQHWFTHMVIDAFVQLITHEPDEKKALQHINKIMQFVENSWVKMILPSNGDDK